MFLIGAQYQVLAEMAETTLRTRLMKNWFFHAIVKENSTSCKAIMVLEVKECTEKKVRDEGAGRSLRRTVLKTELKESRELLSRTTYKKGSLDS